MDGSRDGLNRSRRKNRPKKPPPKPPIGDNLPNPNPSLTSPLETPAKNISSNSPDPMELKTVSVKLGRDLEAHFSPRLSLVCDHLTDHFGVSTSITTLLIEKLKVISAPPTT